MALSMPPNNLTVPQMWAAATCSSKICLQFCIQNTKLQIKDCKESLMHYIPRTLEPVIRRAADEFPVVVLTGPRQSGKTTLLKQCFAHAYGYVSLEPPDVRAAATEDPRGFLALYPPPTIFDEVQYVPGLLP